MMSVRKLLFLGSVLLMGFFKPCAEATPWTWCCWGCDEEPPARPPHPKPATEKAISTLPIARHNADIDPITKAEILSWFKSFDVDPECWHTAHFPEVHF